MASELAKRIYQLEWNQIDVIDAELQEVRGVLSLTADRRYPEDSHGHCWCKKDLTDDAEPHGEFCLRARSLWAMLALPDPPKG